MRREAGGGVLVQDKTGDIQCWEGGGGACDGAVMSCCLISLCKHSKKIEKAGRGERGEGKGRGEGREGEPLGDAPIHKAHIHKSELELRIFLLSQKRARKGSIPPGGLSLK